MFVAGWGYQPSEFWRLTPAEWWRIYECKRPRVAGDGLTSMDIERLSAMLEAEKFKDEVA